eukprot:361603-Chlamydomonas_euryale.AAC.16
MQFGRAHALQSRWYPVYGRVQTCSLAELMSCNPDGTPCTGGCRHAVCSSFPPAAVTGTGVPNMEPRHATSESRRRGAACQHFVTWEGRSAVSSINPKPRAMLQTALTVLMSMH